MGLNYDLYQNPQPKDTGRKPRLHARVVPAGTMDTKKIASLIQDTSTISTADVKGVLSALSKIMSEVLSDGYRVHLEGLGYFQLTLSCPSVRTPREIRAESIRVKSIAYRPDTEMKKRFKMVHCSRVRGKRHSSGYSEIEVDGLLTAHFMDHDYLTNRQLQRICGFTPSTAYRRLKQLITDGKLRRSHLSRNLYEPVEGNYRR